MAPAGPSNNKYVARSIDYPIGWKRIDYRGYDTFDGLNAKFARPLTFETKFLRTALQQGVRRFPINLRPLLGVAKSHSTKGMGFLARGFMRLHEATGDPAWRRKAEFALQWLMENQSPGYQRGLLGKSFRLPIAKLLCAQGPAIRSVDLAHRPRISRRL